MSTTAILRRRRDTAANWTSNNPTPESGQLCFETDTGRHKLGNGSTAWNSLAYVLPYLTATDRLLGRSTSGAGVAEEITCTAAGRAILDDADATAQRATLGLVIGTNVQAYDAELAALAGLSSAADKGIQFTGAGTAGTYDLTTAGKALLDDASASAQRTTLGFGTFLLHTIYPWHHRGDAGMALSDVAAGDAFLGKSNGNVGQLDLTHYTHVRLTCRVTTAATSGTRIVAKYRTVADGYSATIGDYASIGTSTVALDLSSTGVIASSWIALASGAKADVLLCPVQTGGDGATDPVIRLLTMEFKRE